MDKFTGLIVGGPKDGLTLTAMSPRQYFMKTPDPRPVPWTIAEGVESLSSVKYDKIGYQHIRFPTGHGFWVPEEVCRESEELDYIINKLTASYRPAI